jgi:hypothetical protein
VTVSVERVLTNTVASVYHWLKNVQYALNSTTGEETTPGTLEDHFTDLRIQVGYPSDLARLTAPTLAVAEEDVRRVRERYFGGQLRPRVMRIQLYGFVVGQKDSNGNTDTPRAESVSRLYRDRLKSDVYELCVDAEDNVGIPLYEQASKTEIGMLEVVEPVIARVLPANAPEIEADRWKFLVELAVEAA